MKPSRTTFVVLLTLLFAAGITTVPVLVTRRVSSVFVSMDLGAYWDKNCTRVVEEIDWGIMSPGHNYSKTFYVKNLSNRTGSLYADIGNFTPRNASALTIDVRYQTIPIPSQGMVQITLSIRVPEAPPRDLTNFSFDLILTLETSISSKVSFTLSPNPSTIGERVTMLGNLTDILNKLIGNVVLEVYTRIGTGSWLYEGIVSTNSSGWFRATGKKMVAGTYLIAVLYRGSPQYDQSYYIENLAVNP